MNIFDIIGPVMIGPSSSHTAGAVRIGRVCRKILGEPTVHADIGLAGSFARTYKGHGTDKALIAGILGMTPDDERIRDSLTLAGEQGLDYRFREIRRPRAHPNTVEITLTGKEGTCCTIQGASVGGGNILVTQLNGMETAFTGEKDTLIIPHNDVPGTIAAVTSIVADSGINIGNFKLQRSRKAHHSVMTIETDIAIEPGTVAQLKQLPNIINVIYLHTN